MHANLCEFMHATVGEIGGNCKRKRTDRLGNWSNFVHQPPLWQTLLPDVYARSVIYGGYDYVELSGLPAWNIWGPIMTRRRQPRDLNRYETEYTHFFPSFFFLSSKTQQSAAEYISTYPHIIQQLRQRPAGILSCRRWVPTCT